MTRPRAVRRWLPSLFAALALSWSAVGPAAAASGGFVYALQQVNGGANQVHGFRVEATGELTPLPGFPQTSGGTGFAVLNSEHMAYDAADSRLYVVNDGSDTLTAFAVNRATGALTMLPFSPVSLGAGAWKCVAVHPSGSPVVVGDGSAPPGNLASFVVTGSTATAAPGSPFSTVGASPFSCAFSRDGNFVYTGGQTASIAGFSVAPGNGVLTSLPGSPFNSGAAGPVAYATDGAGRLFSANVLAVQVRAFTSAGGVLTGVAGNPFGSGLTVGTHGVLHPAGFYLVTDRGGNQVGVYRLAGSGAATTLTAVSGSPFAAGGVTTNILALTADGKLLLAANADSRNLTVFRVDATTGGLTSVGTQAANTLGATGTIAGLAFVAPPPPLLISTGTGPGGGPHVKLFEFDTTAAAQTQIGGGFMAYDAGFTGGVQATFVKVGADVYIVTGVGSGGGPHIKLFRVTDLATGSVTQLGGGFMAYDSGFTGGARVAATADAAGNLLIVTGVGSGGGAHVKVFQVTNLATGDVMQLGAGFFAYDPAFTGGVNVGAE